VLSRIAYRKQRGRRLLTALAALTIVSGTLVVTSNVLAVHDLGVFELEGNPVNDPAVAGDDWANVCQSVTNGGVAGCGTTQGVAASNTGKTFDAEPNRSASIFTGGGTKDDLDLSGWKWKDGGGLPDKDNLRNAFAARYTGPSSQKLLYFGADRFDNSGDAQIGFWFLQKNVTNQAGGTFGPDAHQIGDILILSDFTNGGTQPTIRVFQWVAAADADAGLNNLHQLAGSLTSAQCGIAAGDDFCALVNGGDGVATAWPFTNKSGQLAYDHGEFYEGGVNLSASIFPPSLQNECFASFMAETRSSQSVSAVLKDFIIGQFQPCESGIVTTPSSTSITLGQSITDSATVTGTGSGTPTGTVNFFVCTAAQLNASGQCETGGTPLGSPTLTADPNDATKATATSNSFTPSTIGHYCFRGVYVPAAGSPYTGASDFSTTECFDVTDVSSIITDQKWLPNDTATVTTTGGTAVSGTVTFKLYENGTCSGTEVATFTDSTVAAGGVFETGNTSVYTTSKTISWKATYVSNNGVQGSTGSCESSVLTIDNNHS
jgi:hypothetical protein